MADQSPPKRPRLSLQIKALSTGPSMRTSRTLAAVVDPKSPTSFNTLSNVYVTAIGRGTPTTQEPLTAINTKGQQPVLRLQTQQEQGTFQQWRDPTPYTANLPDTPLTAQPMSPSVAMEITFPSSIQMTATPPMSAGPVDPAAPAFSFDAKDIQRKQPSSATAQTPTARTPRRRTTFPTSGGRPAPYTHVRGVHSILRNSPLPPRSAQTPISPRRQSLRLAEKAARRVGYESPLTQTITTNLYTKSHIDLLFEEASPYSPSNAAENPEIALDLTMAYTGDETRDGGQTPGPFEEMRRRMAGLGTETPISATSSVTSAGGIRKRKKKDKKRRWVWTIGQDDDEESRSGALAAIKAAAEKPIEAAKPVSTAVPILSAPEPPMRTPRATRAPLMVNVMAAISETAVPEIITPSIESSDYQDSVFDASGDVEMSDTCSVVSEQTDRGVTPSDMDLDMITPTVTRKGMRETPRRRFGSSRLGSEDLINPETGSRRDTPIPADLVVNRDTPIPADLLAN
jgi:hypothetical protein